MFHACVKKAGIGQPPAFCLAEPHGLLAGPLVLRLGLFSCKLAANLRIAVPGFVQMSQPYTFLFTYHGVLILRGDDTDFLNP